MNMQISFLLSLAVWVSAAAVWSQEVPPPLPAPVLGPVSPPPPLDGSPGAVRDGAFPAGANAVLPATGALFPTTELYFPATELHSSAAGPGDRRAGQPYPYTYPYTQPYVYPPLGPYAGPVVMSPQVAVMVPAPPLPKYQWGATVDALFLERSSGGSIPLGYTYYNSASQLPPNVSTDNLYSDDVYFPLAAGLRLEISRKFDNNITLAATYWGLQQWSVGRTIYGDPNQDTVLAFSPLLQLPTLLSGLDNSLGYTYGSQIENVEFNAILRLNPSDPYWEVDWLNGVRYIYLADNFTLTGSDYLNSASEQLAYNTTNNLIGVQTGVLFVHGWSRFQWEAGLKFGLMANIFHQHGTDTASNPPAGFVPYDISNSGSDLSALFEVSVGVRYRLTDNLGLRLGYQFYDITGLALAPRQLGGFGHGGNVALDGFSIGLQANW